MHIFLSHFIFRLILIPNWIITFLVINFDAFTLISMKIYVKYFREIFFVSPWDKLIRFHSNFSTQAPTIFVVCLTHIVSHYLLIWVSQVNFHSLKWILIICAVIKRGTIFAVIFSFIFYETSIFYLISWWNKHKNLCNKNRLSYLGDFIVRANSIMEKNCLLTRRTLKLKKKF